MRSTQVPVGGLAALGVGTALFAGAVALDLRVGDAPIPEWTEEPGWTFAAMGLIQAGLGVVVLWHRRHHPIGWALVGLGFLWILDGLAQSYVRLAVHEQEALPGLTWVLWFLFRFTAVLPMNAAAVLLLFPDGLPRGRWRAAGWVSLALMGAGLVLFVVVPSTQGEIDASLAALVPGVDTDPTSIEALRPVAEHVVTASWVLGSVGFVLALVTVMARYRASRDAERERMRWLAWAVLVMVLLIATSLLVDVTVLNSFFLGAALLVGPVAMVIAIVRPDIVSVENLLVRTLVYGGISVVIVLVDLLALAIISATLGDAFGERQVVLLVLLLAAILYGPMRLRIEGWVRRAVLGDRRDPYAVVSSLASTLERSDDDGAQLGAVVEAVSTAFGLSFVQVEVDRSAGERLVASRGERPDHVRSFPIAYRSRTIGRLTLPAHGVRNHLTARDEVLLADVVRQAAAAIRSSQLSDELQRSREGLVLAREEERRRIRRDLHDGLGPSLSAVVFRLESARLTVASDPASADEQLAETRDVVQEIIKDVRRLVHDLRPPALDDRGLVGALTQLAEHADAAVDVRVTASIDGGLPAAVEVAAFRIASEAMNNTLRHAHARTCSVSLSADPHELVVEVADDGVGIAADARPGIGLVSLRERAAELGGSVELRCPDSGGTIVTARLPLHGRMEP
ncbi:MULTISPECIES: sensor histidine kinase [Aeromicrobium]|uniref:sensor histidine kinase n=1 Tax=Aeromicrobium TaxID=2040 RepID=UPI00257A90EE|nr:MULTISPECIES: sensor histidine kinase [Aeromicrobium]